MRRLGKRTLAAAVLAGSLAIWAATVAASGQDPSGRGPRNVILLIGDGMGDSEITMARNYWKGAGGRLAMDSLPSTGAYTTYSVEEFDPSKPDYVTDSSASATGFATGHKTSDKRIGTSPGDDEDLKTILELAQERGMKTGFATTSGISTATEAAFTSHVRFRGCMGPESMQQCLTDRKSHDGPGSIAEQQVDHGVDVMLGGGRTYFEQRIDAGPDRGQTVLEAARRHGYDVALDANDLRAARRDRKLLGLFSPVGMSAEWSGDPAEPGQGSGPQRCEENRRPEDQPSLVAMARTTLERLENDKGFFALVEGANIDTYSHSANPCQEIGEAVEFDRAVRAGPRLREGPPEHAGGRHRRSRPRRPDRSRGRRDGQPASRRLQHPRHQRGRAHADRLRHGPGGRPPEAHGHPGPYRGAGPRGRTGARRDRPDGPVRER